MIDLLPQARNPSGRTPGLHGVLTVCGAFFLIQLIFQGAAALPVGGPDALTRALALRPGAQPLWSHRFITYGFLHGGFFHLFFNLLTLYFVGKPVEARLGTKNFLFFYLGAVYFSGVLTHVHALAAPWSRGTAVIGASGALCALCVLFWKMFPHATVMAFFVVPVQIRYFLLAALSLDLVGTLFPLPTGLAHSTHFSGYLFGFLLLGSQYWMAQRRRFRPDTPPARPEPVSLISPGGMEREKFYQSRVDPLLKKISRTGMDSLTKEELEILKAASRFKKMPR